MKSTSSPQSQQRWDEEIIKILRRVGSLLIEYPSELFAARRAAFILQVQQQDKDESENALSSTEQLIQYFESLKFDRVDYPPELRTARRAAFLELVEHSRAEIPQEASQHQEITQLFKSLKSVEAEYPPNLMAARRAAFRRQITLRGKVSVLEALRASIQDLFLHQAKMLSMPAMNRMRTSLVVMVLMLAVLAGSLLRNREQAFHSSSPQSGVVQPGVIPPTTDTGETAPVICKPGYQPPLCLAKEFDNSQDLSFLGNGTARPAVAKDTLPGYSGVHKPAHVNDGLYGPGASWISNSPYSWIKIDLGKTTTINVVAFGRDRLGNFNDRDPGQFVIAVALSDNIYADGNSSNDYTEYTEVFNSEQIGFDGTVSGSETVRAQFGPVIARYVKIVFANPGTAVDEVEVFMVQPSRQANYPTKEPKEDLPGSSLTSIPPRTPLPTKTATPIPTNTPLPPTNTPLPTDTPIPPPTNTPEPTDTPIPPPTNTPEPTDTSVPPTEFLESMIAPTEIVMPVDGS